MRMWLRYILLCVVATAMIVVGVTIPEMAGPYSGGEGHIALIVAIGAVGLVSLLTIYVAGLNKWFFTLLCPVYFMAGAVVAYYRLAFHVTLTPLLVDCIVHTNLHEAMGVVSIGLLLSLLLALFCAAVLVWWRWKMEGLGRPWIHLVVVIVMLYALTTPVERLRLAFRQRFPVSIVYSTRSYLQINHLRSQPHTMPAYAKLSEPEELDLVVVIGESLRADHLQLNGYGRPTNPLLAGNDHLVSLPHIRSEQTATHTSVPVMITRADSLHPDLQYTESSFCRIFRDAGYRTAWLSNNEPSNSFAALTTDCDTAVFLNAGKSVFVSANWCDEDILPALDEQLGAEALKRLIVIHTIGSHWYYDQHYTDAFHRFTPTTSSRAIAGNTPEQIVNSYDNSVLYADWFLQELITRLQDRCALLIFMSDHGESLGEDGRWLHAQEANELKNPACVVWYSERYAACYPAKTAALMGNKDRYYRTDCLFHSILSSADMRAEGYTDRNDIFSTTPVSE